MKLKQTLLPLVIAGLVTACIGGKRTTPSEESSSLKAAFGNKFLIGAALNQRQVSGEDTAAIAIAKHHFNSIVAENCMKCEVILIISFSFIAWKVMWATLLSYKIPTVSLSIIVKQLYPQPQPASSSN